MKIIVKTNNGTSSSVLTILFLVALSMSCIGWALHTKDLVSLIVSSVFSLVWLLLGSVLVRTFNRGRSAILSTEDGKLAWEVKSNRKEDLCRGGILLNSVQSMEIIFHSAKYRNYHFATVFLIDIEGKRHQIPEALKPGIYYNKILKAIQESKPDVSLNEKFDNSD